MTAVQMARAIEMTSERGTRSWQEVLCVVILLFAGATAAVIGGFIIAAPALFYSTYGITLGHDVSLLNELRAPAGALFASGLFIASGAVVKRLRFASAVVATLLYLSYGAARLLSIAIDGPPAGGLVQAAIIELLIGVGAVYVLVRAENASLA